MQNENRIRKDFTSLTKTEIEHMNEVFQKAGSKLKNSPYQDIAGFHGLPKDYCHVDDPRDVNDNSKLHSFLGWHRIFLLEFENRLRKVDPNFTLPYLDWASDKCVNLNDIPSELDSFEYLKNALIGPRNTKTTRNKSKTSPLSDLRQNLVDIFSNNFSIKSTQSFGNYLQRGSHNSFHVWVGGSMGQVAFAAYDPIFWMHHANIDRIWTVWQKSTYGSEIQKKETNAPYLKLDFSERGFQGVKYGDVMDNSKLPGGAKVVYENEKTPFSTRTHAKSLNSQPFTQTKSSIITIKNLAHTLNSFNISINGSISENVVHFGSVALFGHGDCCTEEECKKIYKGSRDTFSCSITSFDLKTTDVESFILQIDDVTENKRLSLEAFQKALLKEENNHDPVIISFKDDGGKSVIYKHTKDNVFVRSN